jgi:hypothetical protein
MPIDIKQEAYFPLQFKFFGALIAFGGLVLPNIQNFHIFSILLGLVMLIVGLAMMTTRYGLKIDPDTRSYTIYTWLLGFRIGKPVPFQKIERFYINQSTESMQMTTRGNQVFDIDKQVFKAFMKIDNGDKIHVDTDKSRDRLESRIQDYQKSLADLF